MVLGFGFCFQKLPIGVKIENFSKAKKYKKPSEFVDDINLMFNNCRLYNGPDSEVSQNGF